MTGSQPNDSAVEAAVPVLHPGHVESSGRKDAANSVGAALQKARKQLVAMAKRYSELKSELASLEVKKVKCERAIDEQRKRDATRAAAVSEAENALKAAIDQRKAAEAARKDALKEASKARAVVETSEIKRTKLFFT